MKIAIDKNLIENQKVYDDFDLAKANKNNLLIKCYKYSLLAVLFLMTTIFLFLNQNTIFISYPQYFLKFNSILQKELGIANLIKLFVLFFIIVYSLGKNYLNLNFQKELIQRYWIWFVLYLSLSIVAFGLLVGYDITAKGNGVIALESFYLCLTLIPLLIINISYAVYMYFSKKKTSPLIYGKKINFIIPVVSQTLLIIIGLILFYVWITKGGKTGLTYDNSFYNFWNEVFQVRAIKNLSIISSSFLLLALLILGTYYQTIIFWITKQYNIEYFKNLILFLTIILFSVIIWFFSIFGIKIEKNILVEIPFNITGFIIPFIFSLIIVALYNLSLFWKKIKSKSNFINTIYFATSNFLIWLILILTIFQSKDEEVNRVMIFLTSLLSFGIVLEFLIKVKSLKRYDWTFIVLSLLVNVFAIFLFGINQIMISHSNYAFFVISASFGIVEIFIIINILLFFTFILVVVGILINTIFNINGWKKIKIRGGKNE